jgi:mono/diheme cytochrome c family protein
MNKVGYCSAALLLGVALGMPMRALAADAASVEKGKQVFQTWCEACHGSGGDRPGTLGLEVKYGGKIPARLEDRKDLTPDFIKLYVRNGFAMMAPFRKTEISDADLAALTAYLTRTRK